MDMVKGVVIAVVGFLLVTGLGFTVLHILGVLEENHFKEAEHVDEWAHAEESSAGIMMGDSDYWDDNNNGEQDENEPNRPDKLSDIEENYVYGTNASNPDTDGDGMMDGWEAFYMVKNPITGKYTIDPNVPDGGSNPDGDGLDFSGTGSLNAHFSDTAEWDGGENLTNLEEYCNGTIANILGSEFMDELTVDSKRPELLQTIAENGGFHLCREYVNPATMHKFDYNEYDPWRQLHLGSPIFPTTNPSSPDSDYDGMGDFYEFYHGGNVRAEEKWQGAQYWRTEDNITLYTYTNGTYEIYDYKFSLNPLDPTDAHEDMDLCVIYSYNHVTRPGDPGVSSQYIGHKEYRPDGLTNLEEYQHGTDPLSWDTDGDTFMIPSGTEFRFHDAREVAEDSGGTSPIDPDTDGDLMWDAWETHYGLDPLNASDRFLDMDEDGLSNYLEFAYPSPDEKWWPSTGPLKPDTDGDGIFDGWEAKNALLLDYDDQLYTPSDYEYYITSLDPTVADSHLDVDTIWLDGNGDLIAEPGEYAEEKDNLTNLMEYTGTDLYSYSTDPNNPDTDGDGLNDGNELLDGFPGELLDGIYYTVRGFVSNYYTNASNADTDMDFDEKNKSRVLDDWEEVNGETHDGSIKFHPTNASNPDTDLDGLPDVKEVFGMKMEDFGWVFPDACNVDSDFDELEDAEEVYSTYGYITHPTLPDTDFDQLLDGKEIHTDFYPYKNIHDNEDVDSSDPRDPDTDDDELLDGWEAINGKTRKINLIRYYTMFHGAEIWFDASYASNEYNRPYTGSWETFLDVNGDGLVDDELPAVFVINPLYPYDGEDDSDNDGLTNIQEMENTTDPLNADTDGDELPDGWEIKYRAWVYKPTTGKWGWYLDPIKKNSMDLEKGETVTLDVWDEDLGQIVDAEISGTINVRRWNDEEGSIEDVSFEMTDAYWSLDYQDGIWYPDGVPYYMVNPDELDNQTGMPKLETYYHPLTSKMEFSYGNWDPVNGSDVTLNPNKYDCDGDTICDGKEIYYMDRPLNESDCSDYEENDTLVRGWEDLFNLSIELFDTDYKPTGHVIAPGLYKGKFWATMKDSDGDGTNDGEEDYDGDGVNNTAEFWGNSDPTDSNSKPNNDPFGGGPNRGTETRGNEVYDPPVECEDDCEETEEIKLDMVDKIIMDDCIVIFEKEKRKMDCSSGKSF